MDKQGDEQGELEPAAPPQEEAGETFQLRLPPTEKLIPLAEVAAFYVTVLIATWA